MIGESVEVQLITPLDFPQQEKELTRFFQDGYKEKWIGAELFHNTTLANSSEIIAFRQGEILAAALSINRGRVTDMVVSPNYQGHQLGVRLYQEAIDRYPFAWVTIHMDSKAMLATVADSRLGFQVVEDQEEMEMLFQGINGVNENYYVQLLQMENPFLARRLRRERSGESYFETFYRPGAIHGPGYQQILFKQQI